MVIWRIVLFRRRCSRESACTTTPAHDRRVRGKLITTFQLASRFRIGSRIVMFGALRIQFAGNIESCRQKSPPRGLQSDCSWDQISVLSVAYLDTRSDPNSPIAVPHRPTASPVAVWNVYGYRFSIIHRRRTSRRYPKKRAQRQSTKHGSPAAACFGAMQASATATAPHRNPLHVAPRKSPAAGSQGPSGDTPATKIAHATIPIGGFDLHRSRHKTPPTEENDATTRLKDLFQKILRLGCVGRSVATTDASILHATRIKGIAAFLK